jgi:hypothetical protein
MTSGRAPSSIRTGKLPASAGVMYCWLGRRWSCEAVANPPTSWSRGVHMTSSPPSSESSGAEGSSRDPPNALGCVSM